LIIIRESILIITPQASRNRFANGAPFQKPASCHRDGCDLFRKIIDDYKISNKIMEKDVMNPSQT